MLSIPYPAIFSKEECLWFLNRDHDESLHVLKENSVRRVYKSKSLIELKFEENTLECEIIAGESITKEELLAFVENWIDLKTDLRPFYELLENDQDLKNLATTYKGLRAVGIPSLLETICWSIIGQQINLTFAYKLKRRLVEKVGIGVEYENKLHLAFPEATDLINLKADDLREMQFSKQKINYLYNIAEATLKDELSEKELKSIKTNTERVKYLCQFKGIGEWTAQYTLLKFMHDPEAAMYGDAGLNQALFNLKSIPKKDSRKHQEEVYQVFENYKNYLTFYLWRSLV